MCNCAFCVYGRKVEAWRNSLPEDKQQMADDLYESMCCAEDEVAYYRSIIEGCWPNSVGILRRALSRAKLFEAEQSVGY